MALKKFFVGVKGIVKSERGILLMKHSSGFWDMPGGRLDDDEDLETALDRELKEELPNCKLKLIGEQVGSYRLHKDIVGDTSLVLIYNIVDMEVPENIELSHEHTEYLWIKEENNIPADTDSSMKNIIVKALKTKI